jgi:hypothetical protein
MKLSGIESFVPLCVCVYKSIENKKYKGSFFVLCQEQRKREIGVAPLLVLYFELPKQWCAAINRALAGI